MDPKTFELKDLKKLIKETPLPWNPNQTPQWHLDMWRTSLIWKLEHPKTQPSTEQAESAQSK